MNEYELSANYDARSSFYGKVRVRIEGDKTILRSYSTDVAYIKEGKAYVLGQWSQTTSRHIKEFLLQNDFKVINTKQILNDYPSE